MIRFVVCFLGLVLSLSARADAPATNLLVKDGQTVEFMGDSITGMGWGMPGGYIHLVVDGLAANGVKVTPIPAGIGGNRSTEMLKRVDADVIAKKPDWLTLSCGVNDVWSRSVDLDTFKKQMTEIVDKVQAAGIKVVILTPSPIYEASKQEFNDKLPGYVDFLKQLAKERNLPCADIHQAWLDFIAAANEPKNHNVVTVDGVHPNPDGHLIFAKTILATFGATPAQVAKAEAAWQAEPEGAGVPTSFAFNYKDMPVSADELAALNKICADQKINMVRLLHTAGLEAARDELAKADLSKVDFGAAQRDFELLVKERIDKLTNSPPGASGAAPQQIHVWFSSSAAMPLSQWEALKKAAAARKEPTMQLALHVLFETVRDLLAAAPDLSKTWSDNITHDATPIYTAKLAEIAQKEGGWTPSANAKP